MLQQKNFADPAMLGLAAFVISQLLLNIPNAHLVPVAATPLFLSTILVSGGLIQLFCSVFEYFRGNVFSTTTFGIYGSFFIALGMFVYFELIGVLKFGPAAGDALGTFLLIWSIFTLMITVIAFRESTLLGWMFVFVEFAFIGGALHDLIGINSAFGGWSGIISAAIGLYIVFLGLWEATASKSETQPLTEEIRTAESYQPPNIPAN